MRWPLLLVLSVGGCGADPDSSTQAKHFDAEPWPEADALFRSDPRWLGADGAYSVELDAERTLWLFGDSFIATTPAGVRSESRMVRNSVGVQLGRDPSAAQIEYYWGATAGEPGSFVAEDGANWFWPLHGIRLGDALTLFFLREASVSTGLGFESVGWEALRVSNPDAPPAAWQLQRLQTPKASFPVAVGASVLRQDGFVYAYAVEEPGAHDVYLLRWTESDFAAGDLLSPEWHDGSRGFVAHSALSGAPAPVMKHGQTELTVSALEAAGALVEVQTRGFGATTIAVRQARRPEGKWSELHDVFRPPESDRGDAFVYAGKAHPQLTGADLVVTYAANATDFATLIGDDSLYYPRFVRLTLVPGG
jgi:hypothetical protein